MPGAHLMATPPRRPRRAPEIAPLPAPPRETMSVVMEQDYRHYVESIAQELAGGGSALSIVDVFELGVASLAREKGLPMPPPRITRKTKRRRLG